jgi:hypothetical protein
VSWVWGDVPLYVGSIGCIVDDVANDISWGVSWNISRGVGRLRHFIFASTFFSHWVEGTLATTLLARTLRSASGVGTHR